MSNIWMGNSIDQLDISSTDFDDLLNNQEISAIESNSLDESEDENDVICNTSKINFEYNGKAYSLYLYSTFNNDPNLSIYLGIEPNSQSVYTLPELDIIDINTLKKMMIKNNATCQENFLIGYNEIAANKGIVEKGLSSLIRRWV